MFQRVLQPVWFQSVSFMSTHGLSARPPAKGHGSTSRDVGLQSADTRAHLVVQVEQVRGQVCLVLPISQAAVMSQMQICSDLSCVRSHLDKTTTWHDPRIAQLQSAAAQRPIASAPVHTHSLSNPAQPTTQPQSSISPEPGIVLTLPPPGCNPVSF